MTVRNVIWVWQLAELGLIACLVYPGVSSVMAFGELTRPLVIPVTFTVSILVSVIVMVVIRFAAFFMITSTIRLRRINDPLTSRQFLKYWLGESVAFTLLYGFYQLRPKSTLPDYSDVGERHVILLHGFLCNNGFWVFLAPKLKKAGYSVSTIEMPSAFGSIEHYSAILDAEINRIRAQNSQSSINLVAFSMGGLACRHYLSTSSTIENLITLDTPHYGTYLANLSALLRAKNGQQMRPNSEWIESIRILEGERSSPKAAAKFGFWTTHDNIVLPAELGLPPFKNLRRVGHGHLNAAIDRQLHRHIIRVLNVFTLAKAPSSTSPTKAIQTQS